MLTGEVYHGGRLIECFWDALSAERISPGFPSTSQRIHRGGKTSQGGVLAENF